MATSLPAGLGMQGAGGSPGHPCRGLMELADVQWTLVKSFWCLTVGMLSYQRVHRFPTPLRASASQAPVSRNP